MGGVIIMGGLFVNERSKEFRWTAGKRGQNDKRLLPGETAYLTDAELEDIPLNLRGPGGLRLLSPAPEDVSDLEKTEIEYYTTNGSIEVRYLGEAPQGALTTSPVWTIKRFSHTLAAADDVRITEIQTIRDVAWADRATLGWT